jgi:hypothetical protein
MQPELVIAWIEAREVWRRFGVEDAVMTSANDGRHMPASKHYSGEAFDLRVHGMVDPAGAVAALRKRLTVDFDVVLESVGTTNAHVHVEFDPKVPERIV